MNLTLDDTNNLVRLPQSERAAAWKGRKLTRQGTLPHPRRRRGT